MPVLPVSNFWKNSFSKYYKLRWVQQDLFWLTSDRSPDDSIDYKNPNLPKWFIRYNIQFMVVATLLLTMLMCIIPLSTDVSWTAEPREASTALVVAYESLYVWLGYPAQVQIWILAFPHPVTHRCVRYVLLPFTACLGVTSFCIFVSHGGNIHNLYNFRTLLTTMAAAYIAFIFIAAVYLRQIRKYFCRKDPGDKSQKLLFANQVAGDDGDRNMRFTPESSRYGTKDRSTLNSAILFEESKLSQDSFFGERATDSVDRPGWQCVLVVLTVCGLTACYLWTQYLTHQWRQQSISHNTPTLHIHDANDIWAEMRYILLLYPSFWFVLNVLKFITQRFARLIDANKSSNYSAEIVVVFFINSFYFVFYRNLFLHISSYSNFALVKLLHISLELCSYTLRMSKWYHHRTDALQKMMKRWVMKYDSSCNICCCLAKLVVFSLYDESEFYTWSVRLSLDLTLSFIVSILSAFNYLLGVLWLRFGYNAYFYDLQYVSHDQFGKTLVFTVISIAVEFVLYVLIDKWVKYKFLIECIKYWKVFIQHRPWYLWYFIFTFSHVSHDVLIAKMINLE